MSSIKKNKNKINKKKATKAIMKSLKKKVIGDEEQFRLIVTENGAVLDDRKLFDPFIRTSITVKGWKAAWIVFRKGITYNVNVGGTREAVGVVFDGDYAELPPVKQTVDLNAFSAPQEQAVS